MRIVNLIAIAAAFTVFCAFTSCAEVTKGSVAVNYWMSDFTESGDDTSQNFLPYFTAAVYFDGINAAIMEFSDSGSETNSSGDEMETQRYLFGWRHDFEGGGHITVAYHDMEIEINSMGTADLKGLRIGGGADLKIFRTPWTLMLDFGLGIANDTDIFGMGSLDTDVLEITTAMKYNFPHSGFTGRAGYRHMAIHISGGTINGVNLEEQKNRYAGLFFGLGYDF